MAPIEVPYSSNSPKPTRTQTTGFYSRREHLPRPQPQPAPALSSHQHIGKLHHHNSRLPTHAALNVARGSERGTRLPSPRLPTMGWHIATKPNPQYSIHPSRINIPSDLLLSQSTASLLSTVDVGGTRRAKTRTVHADVLRAYRFQLSAS